MNKRCLLSLWIFLAAIGVFIVAGILSSVPGASVVTGLLCLLMIAAVVCSLVLAALGLRQCAKFPDRYARGKVPAISTLVLGSLLLLLLIPALVNGVRGGMARSQLQKQIREGGFDRLKFAVWNFEYESPRPPWVQADARMFGPGAVLAFARTEPMYFTVCANKLEPGFPDTRARVVELSRSNLLAEATSHQLISEGEVTRNGLAGWQTEQRAAFHGRGFYLVQWLLATNGFGYQLALWGPTALRPDIRREAETLFSNFVAAKHEK